MFYKKVKLFKLLSFDHYAIFFIVMKKVDAGFHSCDSPMARCEGHQRHV